MAFEFEDGQDGERDVVWKEDWLRGEDGLRKDSFVWLVGFLVWEVGVLSLGGACC